MFGALLAIPFTVLMLCAANAHSHKLKALEIVHPWCVETSPTTTTVAVYMVVRNASRRGDKLLRATTAMAEKAELIGAGDAKPVGALEAKAGGELVLKRGGPHILLSGVKKQLDPYGAFFMTLTFERAGKVEVEVQVEEASILEPKHSALAP